MRSRSSFKRGNRGQRDRFRAAAFGAASIAGLVAAALPSGCTSSPAASDGPPTRSCSFTVWHQASDSSSVQLVGDFNGWQTPGTRMAITRNDGWRAARIDVTPSGTANAPSEARYAIIEDGVWLIDPLVATTAYENGREVSWVSIPNCNAPGLTVSNVANVAPATGDATVTLSLTRATSGAPFDGTSFTFTSHDGSPVTADPPVIDDASGTATIQLHGLAHGKHSVTINARDTSGAVADAAVATVWIEDTPFDLRDTVIYQIMIDRFANASGPVARPAVPSARAGGDLAGVQAALDAGKFASLGVNTLWLSPLYKNPTGTFAGTDGRQYSSYHGYWPIDPRGIEDLFGGETALDALIADAHSKGIRVLFDVVPNHVHQQHPYAIEHMTSGWFDDVGGTCICGQGSCDWADNIQQCWFAPYLPDLDWTNGDVADQVSSDVRWWIDRFDGDGVRIDAVPMMPRSATRRIVNAVRTRYDNAGHSSFLLGENFTDQNGYNLLRYELGPYGLNSEFDFPLMWSLRGAIAYAGESTNGQTSEGSGGTGSGAGTSATSSGQTMKDVAAAIAAGNAAWAGSGAVMTSMIGNHDVTRFATAAAFDENGDSWSYAAQPTDPTVYAKQAVALATVFTLQGAPVVYYGDEVGLAGRSDPDSRHVMPSDAELSSAQIDLRAAVGRLGAARKCSEALRRGDYHALYVDDDHLVFRRTSGTDTAIVALTRTPADKAFAVTLPGITKGTYADIFAGGTATLDPELTNLDRAPFSVHIYVPSGSACSPVASSTAASSGSSTTSPASSK
jgi:glycosidase